MGEVFDSIKRGLNEAIEYEKNKKYEYTGIKKEDNMPFEKVDIKKRIKERCDQDPEFKVEYEKLKTCWYTDDICACGGRIATDGKCKWCDKCFRKG